MQLLVTLLFCISSSWAAKVELRLDKMLGERCADDNDCAIAYSKCDRTTFECVCAEQFVKDDKGLCKPIKHFCPDGKGGSREIPEKDVKFCRVSYDTDDDATTYDTCNDEKLMCFTYSNEENGDFSTPGHCCEKVQIEKTTEIPCPKSLPHPGKCIDSGVVPEDPKGPIDARTCPEDTHDCLVQPFNFDRLCCPTPCRGVGKISAIDGRCYEYVHIGDKCLIDPQCEGGSKCLPSKDDKNPGKTCQCEGTLSERGTFCLDDVDEEHKPAEAPKPEQVETPKPERGGETPKPERVQTPTSERIETPKPERAETPKPERGETSKPERVQIPTWERIETPKPERGETPKPERAETPKPERAETPKPEHL